MNFNTSTPSILHLDINSCFATIEQQANPNFRNKPLVVAAYKTNSGCILASSVDAKKLGIKTGMRVKEARLIYPKLIVLEPDPNKYRFIHKKIKKILKSYSNRVTPKSIDEFSLKLPRGLDNFQLAVEIKEKIRKNVGEYVSVSIGISTNRYLAKVASNLKKPDGLIEISSLNYKHIFSNLNLTDLTGIKKANSSRLKRVGINTVVDFYSSPLWKLKIAFGGIGGYYWYLRLHGFEIDDFKSKRKTYGNSFAPSPEKANLTDLIITKLAEKTGYRLRKANLKASGVHIFLADRQGTVWHMGKDLRRYIYDSRDIYKEIKNLIKLSPITSGFKNIAISTFNLESKSSLQLKLFEDEAKKDKLVKSIDSVNEKYGSYTIYPARMIDSKDLIKDRIAFGH